VKAVVRALLHPGLIALYIAIALPVGVMAYQVHMMREEHRDILARIARSNDACAAAYRGSRAAYGLVSEGEIVCIKGPEHTMVGAVTLAHQ
jgi:hypothetical protein